MNPQSWLPGIHHDGSTRYVHHTNGSIGSTVTLTLRTPREAPISRILIRYAPDGEQQCAPMHTSGDDGYTQWWEGAIHLRMPVTNYRFHIITPNESFWLNGEGIHPYTPTDSADFRIIAGYTAPSWTHTSVFYQIFPDRFADGDPQSNVVSGEYSLYGKPVIARQWGEAPLQGGRDFFGGDLQGIIDHLEYLQWLGVTAVYVTPIFTSPSNHKYDVSDYREIDPHFGGNSALAKLSSALHERGMKLMLDITPNHCGSAHPWFQQAVADPNAETAEYFTFHHHPDSYECWLGVSSLPKLNYRSKKLQQEMFAGTDSIMQKWLNAPYSIDAWRLDVANMMGRQGSLQMGNKLGRAIRSELKRNHPQMYLLGEHFFDATTHLQGNEFDGVMNYRGFLLPLQQWIANFANDATEAANWDPSHTISTVGLTTQWQTYLAAIPWQIALQQFNLLDSHDTTRMFSVVQGNMNKMRAVSALLFTYPGIPSVYYGDEVGVQGMRDPDCRRCMNWNTDTWNHDLFEWYRALIHLRTSAPALIHGGYQLLFTGKDTLAYMRETADDSIIIAAQRADDGVETISLQNTDIPDGAHFTEVMSGKTQTVINRALNVHGIAAIGAHIWRMTQK